MDALKKQARQAIRYRTVSAQVRKAEATLYHLRWTAASNEVAEPSAPRIFAGARSPSAPARQAKPQAPGAGIGGTAQLREAEARAGAALHRLNVARQDLDREEQRARTASQNSIDGWCSSPPTPSASSSLPRRQRALARLAAEEETIRREAREAPAATQRRRCQSGEADAECRLAETIFAS